MNDEPQLPEYPLLTPWYRLLDEGDRLLLEHGHRVLALDGAAVRELLPRLLPLLDGTRTVAEIVSAAGAPAEPAIVKALVLLRAHGLLVDGPPGHSGLALHETVNFLAAGSGVPPGVVAGRLLDAKVGVVGDAPAADEAARILRRAGVVRLERRGWADADAGDDLVLAAPAPAEVRAVSAWNDAALAAGLRWLQLLPFDGAFAAIGPLYLPGETACYACYRLRRAACLDLGRTADELDAVPVRAGGGPAVSVAAGAIAAVHALRWLTTGDPSLPGVLYALEGPGGLRLTRHLVLRVPRCPACSASAWASAPLPWFQAALEESA